MFNENVHFSYSGVQVLKLMEYQGKENTVFVNHLEHIQLVLIFI